MLSDLLLNENVDEKILEILEALIQEIDDIDFIRYLKLQARYNSPLKEGYSLFTSAPTNNSMDDLTSRKRKIISGLSLFFEQETERPNINYIADFLINFVQFARNSTFVETIHSKITYVLEIGMSEFLNLQQKDRDKIAMEKSELIRQKTLASYEGQLMLSQLRVIATRERAGLFEEEEVDSELYDLIFRYQKILNSGIARGKLRRVVSLINEEGDQLLELGIYEYLDENNVISYDYKIRSLEGDKREIDWGQPLF